MSATAMMPKATPQLQLAEVALLLSEHKVNAPVVLVGIRGYYARTMGKTAGNDRGIYDDALFIVSPSHFSAWNGNTDPSVARKGIATLLPGAYPYRMGNHGISRPGGGYPAFRPATKGEALPVRRDGETNPRPGIAINIHKGGYGTTSSEGCQTVHPTQWDAFYAALSGEMKRHGQKQFVYLLVE